MQALLSLIYWDLKLQVKYHIVTISLVVAILYILLFRLIFLHPPEEALVILILADPTLIGFLFTGALVLFEKDANTLRALVVTPMQPSQYLWSKAISLSLIAMVFSFLMTFAVRGFRVNYLLLAAGVLLSSVFFVFIGFFGVVRVRNINQFILLLPIFLAPVCLPFLAYLGITDLFNAYFLVPTQASLFLFQGAFGEISSARLAYALAYLPICIGLAYYFARGAFEANLLKGTSA